CNDVCAQMSVLVHPTALDREHSRARVVCCDQKLAACPSGNLTQMTTTVQSESGSFSRSYYHPPMTSTVREIFCRSRIVRRLRRRRRWIPLQRSQLPWLQLLLQVISPSFFLSSFLPNIRFLQTRYDDEQKVCVQTRR